MDPEQFTMEDNTQQIPTPTIQFIPTTQPAHHNQSPPPSQQQQQQQQQHQQNQQQQQQQQHHQQQQQPAIIREGWLLKRGEHIKNWRARYFVLMDDGSLLGFKQKPPPGQYKDPTNNFNVRGCHIAKVESAAHFIFVIRGLSLDQEIERNFSAGNDLDRDTWCNAILNYVAYDRSTNGQHQQQQHLQQQQQHHMMQHHPHHQQQTHSNLSGRSPTSSMIINNNNNIINQTNTIINHHNNNTSTINHPMMGPSQMLNGQMMNGQMLHNFGGQGGNLAYVQEPHRMCLDDFSPIKLIGRGSWGKVMLSREKSTGHLYAVKILKKHVIISQNEVGHTLTESRVLRTTNHPFLIALRYSFRDKERLCFVMEFAAGGELFYHLSLERKFSEEKTRFYGGEIVSALGYLHEHDIIYRDLKLENLLLDKDGHIKIADFGLCKDNIKLTDTTKTFCGTPEYLSPEVIEDNNYGRAVDWWSLGVLLYEMMCGQLPFSNRSTDVLFREILLKPVSFPAILSDHAKHFLNGLLIKDPTKRLGGGPDDAREIMIHPFFKGLDWQLLVEKKIAPPFVPNLSSEADTRYFDRQFTTEPVNLTPIERPLNQPSEIGSSFFTQFSYAAGSELTRY